MRCRIKSYIHNSTTSSWSRSSTWERARFDEKSGFNLYLISSIEMIDLLFMLLVEQTCCLYHFQRVFSNDTICIQYFNGSVKELRRFLYYNKRWSIRLLPQSFPDTQRFTQLLYPAKHLLSPTPIQRQPHFCKKMSLKGTLRIMMKIWTMIKVNRFRSIKAQSIAFDGSSVF